tara:strand:- start:758 stop:922 length:165 start_codon:yes stop_codon:yes gene_type:complete
MKAKDFRVRQAELTNLNYDGEVYETEHKKSTEKPGVNEDTPPLHHEKEETVKPL